jgi:hypothetical protein
MMAVSANCNRLRTTATGGTIWGASTWAREQARAASREILEGFEAIGIDLTGLI